jgi:hypothetical protein
MKLRIHRKICFVAMLLSAFILSCMTSAAQSQRVSIEAKDMTVKELLKTLERLVLLQEIA